ncbi:MAG: SDR family oxidoreductase [Geminicoccaceae bacterium]|nr:SDR family oxidoreductase [Geminicoccaceae bacterium]
MAKTALVTGAGRGIGRAVAARLVADGWRVLAADLEPGTGGEDLYPVRADAGDEADVARLAQEAEDRFGGLDLVVCNAGIMVRKPVTELAFDEWRRVVDTNLTALYLAGRHLAPLLRRRKGSLVAVASTRAHMSEPDTEAYAATKGGIVALTHALAVSLGPDVRVNCISPGWIHTSDEPLSVADHRQHPAGRVGRPDDVAEMISFLADERKAGFVTGAEFVVDGGMTRKMIYV